MPQDRISGIVSRLQQNPGTEHKYQGKRLSPAELLEIANQLGIGKKIIVHSYRKGTGGTITIKL